MKDALWQLDYDITAIYKKFKLYQDKMDSGVTHTGWHLLLEPLPVTTSELVKVRRSSAVNASGE